MNLIAGFVSDCQARGLTAHTIETYRGQLGDFLRLYPDPTSIGLDDLKKYLADLRARGLHGSTLKSYFYAISSFYNYLVFEGRLQTNPIPGFRMRHLSRVKHQMDHQNTRQLISVQDMALLVSAAPGIRERAIIMTLAKTGMRRGELLGLRVDDIDLRRSVIRIPAKAKRTYCMAFIDIELSAVLQAYLLWRAPKARTSWLWITGHGGRIHKDYPAEVIASLGEKLGLHSPGGALELRLTPHCFRHWFTTHLFRNHMRIEYIQFLRGDSLKKDAWQWYNHIDPEEVRQEYLRCMPSLLSLQGFKLHI